MVSRIEERSAERNPACRDLHHHLHHFHRKGMLSSLDVVLQPIWIRGGFSRTLSVDKLDKASGGGSDCTSTARVHHVHTPNATRVRRNSNRWDTASLGQLHQAPTNARHCSNRQWSGQLHQAATNARHTTINRKNKVAPSRAAIQLSMGIFKLSWHKSGNNVWHMKQRLLFYSQHNSNNNETNIENNFLSFSPSPSYPQFICPSPSYPQLYYHRRS